MHFGPYFTFVILFCDLLVSSLMTNTVNRGNVLYGGATIKCLKMKEDTKLKFNRFTSLTHIDDNEIMKTADTATTQSPRRDNILESLLIFLLSFVLEKLLHVKHTQKIQAKLPLVYFGMTFDDFVSISKVSLN